MNQPRHMRINDPRAYRTTTESELVSDLLDLEGWRLLELGCGAARTTRLLVERFGPREIVATDPECLRTPHDAGGRQLSQAPSGGHVA